MPSDTLQNNSSYQSQKQLFASTCLIVGLIISTRLISYLLEEVHYIPFVVDSIIVGLCFFFYYLTQYKGYYSQLIVPLIAVHQISLVFLWFSLDGINGPVFGIYMTSLVGYITIDDKERYWKISAFVVANLLLVILLEQNFPHWITHYPSEKARLIDTCVAVITSILLVTFLSSFIKRRYEEENKRVIAQQNALDIAKRKAEQSNRLLHQLKELQSTFFLADTPKNAFEQLLHILLESTESSYGFIAEVIYDDNFLPTVVPHAQSPISWNALATLVSNLDHNNTADFNFLFDHLQNDKAVLFLNNIDHAIDKKTHIHSFLAIPILQNDHLIAMIGIANRAEGYDQALVNFLNPYVTTYETILQNIHLKTLQKQYEQELKIAKEKAEALVLRKSQFLTNISHELRTPLSLILGPVSNLLRQREGQLSIEALHNSLGMIQTNGNKMLTFIEDIMDLAKLNSDQLVLQKEETLFYPFIKEIHGLFQIQTTYRNINYRLEYLAAHDLMVEIDQRKIEKIINNLLANAFKFTKEAGRITLKITEKEGTISIAVYDTGIGIAQQDLPHIFDRFYQIEHKADRIFSGSGVGLALSQELAELHGCSIAVESTIGKGSCFSFNIPVLKVASFPAQTNQKTIIKSTISTPSNTQRPTILIVEDSPDMRAFLKSVLEAIYTVILAENGKVGLQILEEHYHSINLLITDLMMPEMNGLELVEAVKASSWGSQLPIIMLTAKTNEQSKHHANELGIHDYIIKPFMVDELLASTQKLLHNQEERLTWQTKNEQKNTPNTLLSISPIDQEKLEQAKTVVLDNLDNFEFSVDDLAAALMISKRQLYRFTHSNTGLTPLKFIKEIRLQKARTYLENRTYKTVKEVAYAIGFASAQHFSKNYYAHFGKKPSSYLKKA